MYLNPQYIGTYTTAEESNDTPVGTTNTNLLLKQPQILMAASESEHVAHRGALSSVVDIVAYRVCSGSFVFGKGVDETRRHVIKFSSLQRESAFFVSERCFVESNIIDDDRVLVDRSGRRFATLYNVVCLDGSWRRARSPVAPKYIAGRQRSGNVKGRTLFSTTRYC